MGDTRSHFLWLERIYIPIAAGVFVAFLLIVVLAAIRYRRRGDELPSQKESSHSEVVYAVFLGFVAAFLIGLTYHVEDQVDPVSAHPGLRVNVTAAQWNWRFTYPDYGITVTDPRLPTLVVPAGTVVAFAGTAQDVIHAFWVPERRYKHDLFPGAVVHWDLQWPKPAMSLSGECGVYCGLHHAEMRFLVDAVPPAQFRDWVRREQAKQHPPKKPPPKKGKPS